MSKSKSKEIKIKSTEILENNISLIESLHDEVLMRTSDFLLKRKIYYNGLLKFLRHPINYPGSPEGLKLIVQKRIIDVVSEGWEEIREEGFTIKYVIDIIFKKIFRGGTH
jgi:hypothetical protein